MNREHRFQSILTLFLTFFKIGAFTFGGGYAMIPLIQREVADNRHWITGEDILDIVAIAESTPGPLAINTATFVGYKICGFFGAFAATLGVVLPSFVIISVIALVLRQFEQVQAVQFAFNGIRAGVLALILKAFWNMARQIPRKAVSCCIAAAAFVLAALVKLNVLLVIVLCAAAGLIASLAAERRAR